MGDDSIWDLVLVLELKLQSRDFGRWRFYHETISLRPPFSTIFLILETGSHTSQAVLERLIYHRCS